MKDPLDKSETAFEFFGKEMNILHKAVMGAYNAFIRNPKNVRRKQEARVKMQTLRTPNLRLQQDIYLYDLAAPEALEEIPSEFEKPEYSLPPIDPSDLGDAADVLKIDPEGDAELITAEKDIRIIYLRKLGYEDRDSLPLPLDI